MDFGSLLHADAQFVEQGMIDFISFDGVASVEGEIDDNDWEAEIYAEDFSKYGIAVGHYLFFDNSGWGGLVETIQHISSTGIMKLSGVTWRGLLIRKVVLPPSGSTHKVYTNQTVSAIMTSLVSDFGGMFAVGQTSNSRTVITEQKYRYATVFDALTALLTGDEGDEEDTPDERGMRLGVTYDSDTHKVILTPETVTDHSEEIEFSGDYDMKYTATTAVARYNHIIALGSGTGTNRLVKHVWLLPNGKTTTKRALAAAAGITSGFKEKAMVYDYSSCDDSKELINAARKKLKEHGAQNAITIDFDPPDTDLPLGDIVGLRDRVTGLSDARTITRKILRVTADGVALQYSVE